MRYQTLVFCWSMCAIATGAGAQEASGRLDLDVLSRNLRSQMVVGRVVFAATENTCPQQFGTLRVYPDGSMAELQALFAGSPNQYREAHTVALDDHIYRHHVATEFCRVDIDIREQVRDDGVWTSLLAPRTVTWPSRIPPEEFGRYVDAQNARRSMGSLRQGGVTTLGGNLVFEGIHSCFDAVGDYLIDQHGVALQFVTNLPGDVNRFVMERVDVDDDHSRLYLSHEDCRIEITIGSSVLSQGQWVARSIAPFIEPHLSIHRGGP
jgi:hypothetical protein